MVDNHRSQPCFGRPERYKHGLIHGNKTRFLREKDADKRADRLIRDRIPHLENDREIYKEIETMVEIIQSGELPSAVESAIGKMKVCT